MSLTLCCFSRASQPTKNGFAEAGRASARRMGSGEVLLCHLEAHLLLAFLTGMMRMRLSMETQPCFCISLRYISGLKRCLWAGPSSQLPCIMMFEVPKTNLQIKVWKQAFHKCKTAWIHFQA